MTETSPSAPKQNAFAGWLGAILVRLIVPAWILFGAISKVQGATPKSLPRSILDAGGVLGFEDHFLLLALLVGIEFFFVGFMLFVPKFARLAAVVMLGVFLIVLAIEMFAYGNYESCGCFGEKSLAPTTMFAIDFLLLISIVIFKPRISICVLDKGNRSVIGATLFILLAWFYTASGILYSSKTPPPANAPGSIPLPKSWYPTDLGDWIGKSIDSIELFSWVNGWPHDLHTGKQYVIFYSLTCDHCEALLYAHFEFPRFPTTLVAIPESTEGFNRDGAFENPCFDCAKTELAVGPDWIVGTPLVVAIDDGIVTCAVENEDYEVPTCLMW